ncbi:hypothetical protein CSW98_01295 [Vibrio sp. HA2012]|uniref:hypothetical protein n=1 Tax=Vibrio sp. HA2012 TaxID=1971595 RepID=UPI000C2B88A3|nr:hypothetical protein [Vibrio sp. HA2012]PJC87791.1 hypothetical protein CSW98_01295 [Vibrio sp. HA2012]
MARKFTRIEFEDGSVVVVKTAGSASNSDEYMVEGNQVSSWGFNTCFENISYGNLVSRVIDNTGKRVVRTVSHSIK